MAGAQENTWMWLFFFFFCLTKTSAFLLLLLVCARLPLKKFLLAKNLILRYYFENCQIFFRAHLAIGYPCHFRADILGHLKLPFFFSFNFLNFFLGFCVFPKNTFWADTQTQTDCIIFWLLVGSSSDFVCRRLSEAHNGGSRKWV